ncbi:MAG: hypothetical protein Q9214_000509, partial [Letrouitia sp. 1 TL-2023]
MFFKFFAQRYLKKTKSSSPPPLKENVQVSSKEAARDIKKEIQEAMDSNQNDLQANFSDVPSKIMATFNSAKEGGASVREKARETASQASDVLQDKIQAGTDIASEKVNELNKQFKGSKEDNRANGITQDDLSKPEQSDEA